MLIISTRLSPFSSSRGTWPQQLIYAKSCHILAIGITPIGGPLGGWALASLDGFIVSGAGVLQFLTRNWVIGTDEGYL